MTITGKSPKLNYLFWGVGGGGRGEGVEKSEGYQRLSLDPIDLSPFGHLMKFTQRSFPLY